MSIVYEIGRLLGLEKYWACHTCKNLAAGEVCMVGVEYRVKNPHHETEKPMDCGRRWARSYKVTSHICVRREPRP